MTAHSGFQLFVDDFDRERFVVRFRLQRDFVKPRTTRHKLFDFGSHFGRYRTNQMTRTPDVE